MEDITGARDATAIFLRHPGILETIFLILQRDREALLEQQVLMAASVVSDTYVGVQQKEQR